MFKSSLREKWNAGTPTINGWLSVNSTFSAEVMAAQDFDAVTIDAQHGVFGMEAVLPLLTAICGSGCAAGVRVPWRDPGDLMKSLDMGAEMIICPMVNTQEEAEELASFCRYPPRGQRSFGPTRANFAVSPKYFETANDEVIILAMIETGEALKNVEAIARTDGIDGVYIGPSDLTLGVTNGRLDPGQDREEDEMLDAIHTILKAAKAAGKYACIHTANPLYAAKALGWGFNMVTIGSDAAFIAKGAATAIKTCRDAVGQDASEGVQSGY